MQNSLQKFLHVKFSTCCSDMSGFVSYHPTLEIFIDFFSPKCLFYFYSTFRENQTIFDPLGRPTDTADSDNCFRTCCPYVRPHFSKSSKTKQIQATTIFTPNETVSLAGRIIDDTCFVYFRLGCLGWLRMALTRPHISAASCQQISQESARISGKAKS